MHCSLSLSPKEYAQTEQEMRFRHQQQLNEEKRKMMGEETQHQNEVGFFSIRTIPHRRVLRDF